MAVATFVVTAVLALISTAFGIVNLGGPGAPDDLASLLSIVPAAGFSFVGLLIARRRPENRVAGLSLAIGLLLVVLTASHSVPAWAARRTALPLDVIEWMLWPQWVWVPMTGLMGIHLPLRLPDGRLLSRGWRWYSHACTVVIALVSLWAITDPELVSAAPGSSNPTAAEWRAPLTPLFFLLPLCLAGALASLVVRYRSAASHERQQIRAIAFGIAVFVTVFGLAYVANVALRPAPMSIVGKAVPVLLVIGMAAIPAAIGVAVMRYRLYDIDRVISRTVSYAVLTGVLGAVYAAGVVGLGTLHADSNVAVAASTLVVAALFGPVRRRVQTLVDRRFNRPRYDSEQTVQAFAARLREEVDLDELSAALLNAVDATVQPARSSLWLRSP